MTALFAAAVLASARLHVPAHQAPSSRPRKIKACCSRVTKAPQYANLDYTDAYGHKLDQALSLVPREPICGFIVNGNRGRTRASPA